jgi:acetyltransferase-like isoleucine patch superfamily enzyme
MTERVEPKNLPIWRRLLTAATTEFVGIHPRLHAYNVAIRLLPTGVAAGLRGRLLRRAGFDIGEHTEIAGPLGITGARSLLPRLHIGADCKIDAQCILDVSEQLHIGDRVTIEPGVMILTSTHELDFPQHRAGKTILSPVTIGDGAWIRARAVILPGVKIGAGAVVEAGSVVNKDVEPNTRVGGSPAAKLEVLKAGDEA